MAQADAEKLRAAIQNGFDFLDVRSFSIEKMAEMCRKAADVCEKSAQQDDGQ